MELATRCPGRASRRFILAAWMQLIFVSSLIIPAYSHRINEMMELRGSMARYQEMIIHSSGSKRDLLQEDNESIQEQLQGAQQEAMDPEKYVEEFHDQGEVVVHSDTKIPVEEEDGGTLELEMEEQRPKEAEDVALSELNISDQQDDQRGEQEDATEEQGQEVPETKSDFADSEVESQSDEQMSQQEEESEVREATEQQVKGGEAEEEIKEVTELQHIEEMKAGVKEMTEEENKVTEGQETEELKEANDNNEKQEKVEEEIGPIVIPEPHYLLGPTIKDWDKQRSEWLEENPEMKSLPDGKPRVLIVTGSQPKACSCPIGDNFHVRSLKLKIDYARMHNHELFYSIVHLDPLFDRYWVKLPTIRKLMLTHPEIEWFFWVDSDAVFTDMLFEAPFKDYDGYNMVMWAWEDGLLKQKSWVAYNAGVFLIRNCQWTLDLIDKWSPFGPKGPLRQSLGKLLSAHLTQRAPDEECDDQSALAYLIINDEEVRNKVKLVDSWDYMMSGYWVEVGETFEESMEKYHPGLGDHRWPWITHLVGCSPCSCGSNPGYSFAKCMSVFDKAYNFADNQVLAYMGFQHESLESPNVTRIRDETDRPLEVLTVNPWAERIAEVAARGEKASLSG